MTFKRGESGNPGGRPKGTGYRQQLFNDLVEPHKEALFDIAIKLAFSGNEAMIRLFLERMLPARPADDTINLNLPSQDLKDAGELLSYGEGILKAVSSNDITPQQARTLMGSVEIQLKQVELLKIIERVKAIEKLLKKRKGG